MPSKNFVLPQMLFVGVFLVSFSALRAAASNDLTVKVQTGILVGAREDGVRAFKNVPFAAPPVGNLRWAPPQPPLQWDGERAADRFGPPCTQLDVARMSE